jgi:hypothetical protein
MDRRIWLFRRRLWIGFGAGAVAVAGGVLAVLPHSSGGPSVPAPVSHVDGATRACLLTSDTGDPVDAAHTWTALQDVARGDAKLIVQRFQLPAKAEPAAYLNTLFQLRCTRVVTAGDEARAAVAARLKLGKVPGVRFVVVADRRVSGAAGLSPRSVSESTLRPLLR